MRIVFLSAAPARMSTSSMFGVSTLLLAGSMIGSAQTTMSSMAPAGQPASINAADQNKQLAEQITELRAQVSRLQAAVQQNGAGSRLPAKGMKATAAPAKGMAMGDMGMAPKQGMRMKDDQGEMGAMAPVGGNASMSPGMGMMDGMPMGGNSAMSNAPSPAMGMCCMGEMGSPMPAATRSGAGSMEAMNSPYSAMPGQAGASHLYHIGSNGFFLNHSQHITLTADQKLTLNRLKEKAMLDRASAQRRIDQGEQELYSLTGADQLDNARVQAKIGEIEKVRAEQRMNFIRAVSDASNVLTHDQHLALLGTMATPKR